MPGVIRVLSRRVLPSLCVVILGVLRAGAQDFRGDDERPHQVMTVALPALLDLGLLAGAPFEILHSEAGEGAAPLETLQRRRARRRVTLQRLIEGALLNLDFVQLEGEEALRGRLGSASGLKEQAMLAQERLELGRERWLSLESEEALVHLDRARDLMLDAFVDLVVPERFAEVEFQRGLVLADLGQVGAAERAFQTMFLFDPARRFAKGWFGDRIEALLERGAMAALQTADPSALRFAFERLAAFAKRSDVRYWLIGLTRPDPTSEESATLELRLLDILPASVSATPAETRLGSFEVSAVAGGGPSQPVLRRPDRLERWLTAWHVCALEREPRPLNWLPTRRSTFFVDLGFRHDIWLAHRQVRERLHGPGLQIGFQWEPSPLFQLWARLAHVTTLPDRRGDLLDRFGTTRIGLGGALRLGGERLSVALRVGFEGAISLTDLTATSDVNCKFFGPESPRCGRVFSASAPLGWFGFDTSTQVRWQPDSGWYLALTIGVSSYVLGVEAARELNFPFNAAVAIGASL